MKIIYLGILCSLLASACVPDLLPTGKACTSDSECAGSPIAHYCNEVEPKVCLPGDGPGVAPRPNRPPLLTTGAVVVSTGADFEGKLEFIDDDPPELVVVTEATTALGATGATAAVFADHGFVITAAEAPGVAQFGVVYRDADHVVSGNVVVVVVDRSERDPLDFDGDESAFFDIPRNWNGNDVDERPDRDTGAVIFAGAVDAVDVRVAGETKTLTVGPQAALTLDQPLTVRGSHAVSVGTLGGAAALQLRTDDDVLVAGHFGLINHDGAPARIGGSTEATGWLGGGNAIVVEAGRLFVSSALVAADVDASADDTLVAAGSLVIDRARGHFNSAGNVSIVDGAGGFLSVNGGIIDAGLARWAQIDVDGPVTINASTASNDAVFASTVTLDDSLGVVVVDVADLLQLRPGFKAGPDPTRPESEVKAGRCDVADRVVVPSWIHCANLVGDNDAPLPDGRVGGGANEGEGEGDVAEGEGESLGEGEGDVVGEGEGEGEGDVAGEGEGEGEGDVVGEGEGEPATDLDVIDETLAPPEGCPNGIDPLGTVDGVIVVAVADEEANVRPVAKDVVLAPELLGAATRTTYAGDVNASAISSDGTHVTVDVTPLARRGPGRTRLLVPAIVRATANSVCVTVDVFRVDTAATRAILPGTSDVGVDLDKPGSWGGFVPTDTDDVFIGAAASDHNVGGETLTTPLFRGRRVFVETGAVIAAPLSFGFDSIGGANAVIIGGRVDGSVNVGNDGVIGGQMANLHGIDVHAATPTLIANAFPTAAPPLVLAVDREVRVTLSCAEHTFNLHQTRGRVDVCGSMIATSSHRFLGGVLDISPSQSGPIVRIDDATGDDSNSGHTMTIHLPATVQWRPSPFRTTSTVIIDAEVRAALNGIRLDSNGEFAVLSGDDVAGVCGNGPFLVGGKPRNLLAECP